MFEKRSSKIEIMDDLTVSGAVIDQTLKELAIINRKLGGNKISLSAFKNLLKKYPDISRVADLGCGGADILIAMAKIARSMNCQVAFEGVDANPHIVNYASRCTSDWENIHISCENIFDQSFREKSYDIIHCCLFTHHFTEEELIVLFRAFKKQARIALIINDLHRHWMAYHSIDLITRFFSKSYMVRNDAAISVARGFRKKELLKILNAAGMDDFDLHWKWAFRWQLIVYL